MLACPLGREVNETLEFRSTLYMHKNQLPMPWKSRALTLPSTSVLSLWEVKEELGSEPLYTQRDTINRFLSVKAKFHKDASVGSKKTRDAEASWGERSHMENVINRKDYRGCLCMCGCGQRAVRNIKGLGRPPTEPSSLGKGHFYLLHVRQNLRQLPKTSPQI